jgi:hypothetical protein
MTPQLTSRLQFLEMGTQSRWRRFSSDGKAYHLSAGHTPEGLTMQYIFFSFTGTAIVKAQIESCTNVIDSTFG